MIEIVLDDQDRVVVRSTIDGRSAYARTVSTSDTLSDQVDAVQDVLQSVLYRLALELGDTLDVAGDDYAVRLERR